MPTDTRARQVLKMGDHMFSQRGNVDSMWQEIALNFYPERADFTDKRTDGEEFADHLFTSFPVLARRELGNLIASSLRPRATKWFSIHVQDEDLDKGNSERAFLEHLSEIQWRAMYESGAVLVRATKQADHDFAAFGNAVIRQGPNVDGNGLFHKSYHLRDCAWSENAEGKIDALHRNWLPTARQLAQLFPKKISAEVRKMAEKTPDKTVKCRHVVLPSRLYHFKSERGRAFPFVSLYVERDSDTVLEEVGQNYFGYIVPRWQTVSGSVYGASMATAVALPDGRTMQAVVRTLREAGEKYVDPPMVAVGEAIRGDYNVYAGGITQADMEYDEKLGEVLRPITQNRGGMPIGFDIAAALQEDMRSAFFLDKIQLPDTGHDMTAFEVRRRIEEHIRQASPIWEPVEEEYSTPLCEGDFDILRAMGAFPMDQMPESLRDAELNFTFRSPLADLADQNEMEIYTEIMERVVIPASEVDPSQMAHVNLSSSTRDAMRAGGWKADWFNPEEAVEQAKQANAQKQAQAEQMEQLQQGADIAKAAGPGVKALSEAGEGGQ